MKKNETQFLSVQQFAKRLGKHPNSIYRAIWSNRISAIRIGQSKNSTYRIPVSELERVGLIDLEEIINDMVEKKLKERLEQEKKQ